MYYRKENLNKQETQIDISPWNNNQGTLTDEKYLSPQNT